MRFAVIGTGAVGGYFGGRLAAAGFDVRFLARSSTLEALRRRSLRLHGPLGDVSVRVLATDDPREIGPVDVVLFAVKAQDTHSAAGLLPPLITETTAVLSLQNGIENEEVLAQHVGSEHVMGAVCFLFARVAEPGVVEQRGRLARIVFGEMDGRDSERCHRLLEVMTKSDIEAKFSTSIRAVLWEKFAFICAQAGLTAAARAPIGVIRETPGAMDVFSRLSSEVCALAAAEGVKLSPDTTENHRALAQNLSPDSYSSLHTDMVSGRSLELEALHGAVARRAQRLGVDVTANTTVLGILRAGAAARPSHDEP